MEIPNRPHPWEETQEDLQQPKSKNLDEWKTKTEADLGERGGEGETLRQLARDRSPPGGAIKGETCVGARLADGTPRGATERGTSYKSGAAAGQEKQHFDSKHWKKTFDTSQRENNNKPSRATSCSPTAQQLPTGTLHTSRNVWFFFNPQAVSLRQSALIGCWGDEKEKPLSVFNPWFHPFSAVSLHLPFFFPDQ